MENRRNWRFGAGLGLPASPVFAYPTSVLSQKNASCRKARFLHFIYSFTLLRESVNCSEAVGSFKEHDVLAHDFSCRDDNIINGMRFGMQLLHATWRRSLGISALQHGSAGSTQSVALLSHVRDIHRPSFSGGFPSFNGCKDLSTVCKAGTKSAGGDGEGKSALRDDKEGMRP
eukprot:1161947-Pelagomonas_calceolata.AAC.15